MTVCIAAICKWQDKPIIVGASDRMVTAGDIEFEPPQPKIFSLSTSTVALMAGNSQMQTEICNRTLAILQSHPTANVGEIAEIFGGEFASFRRQRAERAILAPLGLSSESFLKQQHGMNPGLVGNLADALQDSRIGVQTIITGVDSLGAHIYVVNDPGTATCNDIIGFAAVGYGANHAQSQFMFSRYVKEWEFARALFLTYSAKRRAESAPNVGLDTDIFVITLSAGFQSLNETTLDYVKLVFEEAKEKESQVIEEGHKQVEEIFNPVSEQQPETQRGQVPLSDEEYEEIFGETENEPSEGESEEDKDTPDKE